MKFEIIIVGRPRRLCRCDSRCPARNEDGDRVERQHLGGICLNWGCISTKAPLRSTEVFELMRHARDYGLAADNVRC
jgi:pyruvate/2-oxoglutarate dehydrogenase complex dihydrolipoamide dehydrogenase (E3) component